MLNCRYVQKLLGFKTFFSEILGISQVPQFKDSCITYLFHESCPSVQTPDVISKGDLFNNKFCGYLNVAFLHDYALPMETIKQTLCSVCITGTDHQN